MDTIPVMPLPAAIQQLVRDSLRGTLEAPPTDTVVPACAPGRFEEIMAFGEPLIRGDSANVDVLWMPACRLDPRRPSGGGWVNFFLLRTPNGWQIRPPMVQAISSLNAVTERRRQGRTMAA